MSPTARGVRAPGLAAALCLILGGATAAEAQTIEWTVRDRPVGAGASVPTVEPHVAAAPNDADHLVVGTIVAGATGPPWHCAALATFDRGATWRRTDFADRERCIDPWVAMLSPDSVLFTGIEIGDGEGASRFRLFSYLSADGGRSWTPEADTLGRGFDHQIVVRAGMSHGSALYLGARRGSTSPEGRPRHRVWIGSLAEGGGALTPRSSILPAATALNVTGVLPLLDGGLVVTYWDFQRDVDGFGREGALDRGRAWALRSPDGGHGFAEPVLIGDECASGGLAGAFPGYPAAAVDTTRGPFADRLYHACIRPELRGVAVSFSVDGGLRWSAPLRVDTARSTPGTPHARTPMLAVGPNGTLAVAWYDRRHDPERGCQDVYVTLSTDGGESFAAPVRATSESSCPREGDNGRVAESWPMGGDYGSLAAAADGTFHLVWADSRDGLFRLRRAAFRAEGGERP